MISFCTTSKNRLHHLRITLPPNLERLTDGDEIVLLNYGSNDGMDAWVKETFTKELGTKLNYFHIEHTTHFSRSHAKNVAHLCARNSIVCNVDADNWITEQFVDVLHEAFAEENRLVGCFADAHICGIRGRIALRKDDFLALGGYNEAFIGWGAEDDDVIARAIKAGIPPMYFAWRYAHRIRHPKAESTKFHKFKNVRNTHAHNWRMSCNNQKAGILTANLNKEWGKATVHYNFGAKVEIGHKNGAGLFPQSNSIKEGSDR